MYKAISKKSIFLLLITQIFLTSVAYAQTSQARSEHVEAELVPEQLSINPGSNFTVALRLKMDPHWHTYWINGGDAGLPTEIEWTLPEGLSAGEIQFPFPEKIVTPPLVSYGYHDEIYLLIDFKTEPNLKIGQNLVLKARADWLECEEACIPGGVDLEITLPVKKETAALNEKYIEAFSEARQKLPLDKSDWQFVAQFKESNIIIQAKAPEWYTGDLGKVEYFPNEYGVIEYIAEQKSVYENGVLTLTLTRPEQEEYEKVDLTGLLVSQNGWRGTGSERGHYVTPQEGEAFASTQNSQGSSTVTDIIYALLFAFAGGMILNLMPCVLPVLSLKIMGFVQQAGEKKNEAWKHGAVFTLGVLLSFWVLAGSLLILRAGGEQLGWGFQLQEPIFLILLSAFLFLFGLSMFGVFEIGTSLTTIEGKTGQKSGFMGSFVSGITATVVATPCTAPFMGSALGFALTQPAWVSMSIFTFLGLGMAFPYVLLASIPSLLKFVPKPGRWMESMKEFMGFLLLATVLWLLWVLGLQAGTNLLIVVLAALLVMGVAGWIYGRWGSIAMPVKSRRISSFIAIVLVAFSLYYSVANVDAFAVTPQAATNNNADIAWENYSEPLLEKYKDAQEPIFLDFTAAWCLSCQVNEKVTFTSKEVQNTFKDMGIKPIKADWTSRDAEITKALASFGRNSVPLYVYFPKGKSSAPILLPEIITPSIVLDVLKNN